MTKQLVIERTESGCLVPTSHKLNKDGYFRKNLGNGLWAMYHRYVWERHNGKIPEGFEVNHTCKNRACCNVCHLELLGGGDHATETNLTRYADVKVKGYEMWNTGHSAKEIAAVVDRDVSSVYYWIRSWKNNDHSNC